MLVDLKARLLADPSGFKAGLASAQRDLDRFNARAQTGARAFNGAFASMGASLGSFGHGLAAMGVVFGLHELIDNAREFQHEINTIAAISRAAAPDLARMEGLIRRIGLASGAGANEVSHAALELVRVGVTFDEISRGALETVVTMSRATGASVEAGSLAAIHAMRDFHIEVGDLNQVVNEAAGVIKHSTFQLQDYSDALGTGGVAAYSAGVNIHDFNAALALTATAFNSGQQAGTTFKMFLQRLTPQGEAAREMMERLNFSAYDQHGNFVGLEEIIRRLQASYRNLSDEQRNQATSVMFGARAQGLLNALVNHGVDEFIHMRDEVLREVDAAEIARRRWEGVNGALANLNAQWEDLSITVSEGGVADGLTNIIGAVGELIGVLRTALGLFNQLSQFLNGNAATPNLEAPTSQLQTQIAAQQNTIASLRRQIGIQADYLRTGALRDTSRYDQLIAELHERENNIRLLQAEQGRRRPGQEHASPRPPHFLAPEPEIDPENGGRAFGDGTAGGLDASAMRRMQREAETAQREQEDTYARHLERMRELGADASGEIATDALREWEQAQDWINEQFGEIETTFSDKLSTFADGIADAFYNGFEQAFVSGDWSQLTESLKHDFMQILWDVFIGDEMRSWIRTIATALKGFLQNVLGNVLQGGGGGGGTVSTIISAVASVFGKRAGGGPVSQPVIVGEHGPELFDPHGGSGNIVPLTRSFPGGGGGNTFNYAPTIDARGVDAAQVARLDANQRALMENLEPLVLGIVNHNVSRRKIGG